MMPVVQVVEYLEEIDSVVNGSVEEALLLSTTLQEFLLEHKSIDGIMCTWGYMERLSGSLYM
jgi:hypothetical protein